MLFEYVVMSKQQSSLTLSKMQLAISKCSTIFHIAAMSKYNTLSKWELSLTLAGFPLLVDYSSVRLTNEKTIKVAENCLYLISIETLSKVFFDLFCAAQIVKLLLKNDTISYYVICPC